MLDHALWLYIHKGPSSSRFSSATVNDVILLCTNMSPEQRAETGLKEESTKKRFVLLPLRLHSVAEDRLLVMNAREENHRAQKKELNPLKCSELSNNA